MAKKVAPFAAHIDLRRAESALFSEVKPDFWAAARFVAGKKSSKIVKITIIVIKYSLNKSVSGAPLNTKLKRCATALGARRNP